MPLGTLLLLLGSCTPAAPEPAARPTGLAADLDNLRSPDNLLFPPELWSALTPSALSEVLHNLARQATGDPTSWSKTAKGLHPALTEETNEVAAAALLVEAGLESPVDARTVTGWLSAAERGVPGRDALERLWQATTVATQTGNPVRLGETARADLLKLHDDPSPWVQMQVVEVLTRAGHETPAPSAAGTWLASLEEGTDVALLARELYGWVALHPGVPGMSTDPGYWRPLLDRAAFDDYTYSYAVRAFARAGNPALTRLFADQFDEERLVAGGILEAPVFAGSLGSTFRMIRYLRIAPEGPGLIDPQWSSKVLAATGPLTGRDISHRLAGAAIGHLLGTQSTPQQRAAVVAEFLKEAEADAPTLTTPEAVMAWISAAEHADVLDVPLRSPEITPAALTSLFAPQDDNRYAAARLLLALQGTGSADNHLLDRLAAHMARTLGDRPLDQMNSLLLFAGSLGLARAGLDLPVGEAELLAEIDGRRGDCLGGFHAFVREWGAAGSVCNVEATRYATQLKEELS